MPKLIKFPLFYDEARPIKAPVPVDGPCHLGTLQILRSTVRINIKSQDSYVTIITPYDDYTIQYTVPKELYNCVGWNRTNVSFTVTIWDTRGSCTFLIPALNNSV